MAAPCTYCKMRLKRCWWRPRSTSTSRLIMIRWSAAARMSTSLRRAITQCVSADMIKEVCFRTRLHDADFLHWHQNMLMCNSCIIRWLGKWPYSHTCFPPRRGAPEPALLWQILFFPPGNKDAGWLDTSLLKIFELSLCREYFAYLKITTASRFQTMYLNSDFKISLLRPVTLCI